MYMSKPVTPDFKKISEMLTLVWKEVLRITVDTPHLRQHLTDQSARSILVSAPELAAEEVAMAMVFAAKQKESIKRLVWQAMTGSTVCAWVGEQCYGTGDIKRLIESGCNMPDGYLAHKINSRPAYDYPLVG